MDTDPLLSDPPLPDNGENAEPADSPAPTPPTKDWHPMSAHPVFVVEDTFYRSRTPNLTHWSVAWSDLMMTMFVLFLTLFVYQMAHREFLRKDDVEVVAGQALPLPPGTTEAGVPFYPISPQLSQRKADQIRTVERLRIGERQDLSSLDNPQVPVHEQPPAQQAEPSRSEPPAAVVPPAQADPVSEPAVSPPSPGREEVLTAIYDLSRETLTDEQLERFARIELIPDKTMRIVLTGDLLFPSGKAELTPEAVGSLRKLSEAIRRTPYMINVVGHTDSVPMHSALYATNWELSLARASRVARFLIEDTGMPARQFVVSGFGHYRPLQPNTSEDNRRQNRRVEIILSKETAPVPATAPTP